MSNKQATDEQAYVRFLMKARAGSMFAEHCYGIAFVYSSYTFLTAGTVGGIIFGLVTAYLAKYTSDALTKHRKDLARLRFLLDQMRDGYYLKEALAGFTQDIQDDLIKKYFKNIL